MTQAINQEDIGRTGFKAAASNFTLQVIPAVLGFTMTPATLTFSEMLGGESAYQYLTFRQNELTVGVGQPTTPMTVQLITSDTDGDGSIDSGDIPRGISFPSGSTVTIPPRSTSGGDTAQLQVYAAYSAFTPGSTTLYSLKFARPEYVAATEKSVGLTILRDTPTNISSTIYAQSNGHQTNMGYVSASPAPHWLSGNHQPAWPWVVEISIVSGAITESRFWMGGDSGKLTYLSGSITGWDAVGDGSYMPRGSVSGLDWYGGAVTVNFGITVLGGA